MAKLEKDVLDLCLAALVQHKELTEALKEQKRLSEELARMKSWHDQVSRELLDARKEIIRLNGEILVLQDSCNRAWEFAAMEMGEQPIAPWGDK